LQTLSKFTFTTFTILISALFYGCSGHALQDLIDGKTTSKSSSEESAHVHKKPTTVAPSQNKALNSISPSSTSDDKHKDDRYMQKSIDEWIEKDWEPLTESNTSISKKQKNTSNEDNTTLIDESNSTRSVDDINSTGLQYYVDKAGIYLENKKRRDANKTKTPSHTEKLDAMPGIGKSKSRR